jgi:hypothetical protein
MSGMGQVQGRDAGQGHGHMGVGAEGAASGMAMGAVHEGMAGAGVAGMNSRGQAMGSTMMEGRDREMGAENRETGLTGGRAGIGR